VWGVLLGYWGLGGGNEIAFFNSGYHDLGLLQVNYHSCLCTYVKVCYYSYAKFMLQLVSLVKLVSIYLKTSML